MVRRGGMKFSQHDVHYLLLSLFCIILMAVSVKLPVLNHLFQQTVVAAGVPFVQAAGVPAKVSMDLSAWLKDVSTVHASNKKLKEEMQLLEQEVNNLKRVAHENRRLTDLLAVVRELKGEPITTHILMDPSSPFRRTVLWVRVSVMVWLRGKKSLVVMAL